MKTILYVTLLILNAASFASVTDSTLNYDLNYDGNDESIRLIHNNEGEPFTLKINDAEISGTFNEGYMSEIRIIDINRNDNLREVVVLSYGSSDQTECFFFQYIDGRIVKCGYLPGNFGFTAAGNGIVTENGYMGFWTIRLKYDFDSRNKTLELIEEEFYDVDLPVEVISEFKLLRTRDDNSEVVAILKPGTKLTIVKADVTPVCAENEKYIDDMMCDWFLLRTEDGIEGWIRLKDFNEKVDGLIWAG